MPKKYGHGKWRRGRKKLPFAVDLNDIIDFQTNTENTFFSQNEVTLYPNPVKDMLKVDFEYPYEGIISIHDASLRTISFQKRTK